MISEKSPLYRIFRFYLRKQQAYHFAFGTSNPLHGVLLADLAKYCCADRPCENERDAGRRDVWLRIRRMMRLKDEEVTALYARLTPEQRFQIFNKVETYIEE